jgi:DNA polymerase III sliding clamp (beta) subunit (PCNA family)
MISLSVSDLKPAIAGLSKVVSGKAPLEPLRCVRVDATPERVSIMGTDLEIFARVELPEAKCDTAESFLLPLDRLQSMAKRFSPRTVINIEPGKISCDLGTGRVSENIEAPKVEEFPEEPEFEFNTVALPESFARRFTEAMGCSSTDATRYILNGVQLDVSDPASHYTVGTDGRHLFSANSFALPLSDSATIPNHKLLMWRGLADLPWALAGQKKSDPKKTEVSLVRIAAGNWTLTIKTIEGNYPNWRQVVPKTEQHRTTVTLPDEHEFTTIVNGLPGGDLKDQPVDLVIKNGTVSVKDTTGGCSIVLAGATANGPEMKIRLNRDYLTKAFQYGLTTIGLIDPMSALHFIKEGRQMVVMPVRVADVIPAEEPTDKQEVSVGPSAEPTTAQAETETTPAPSEPQPERKPMTETIGHTNGAATPYLNGAPRSTTPVIQAADKPAIEVAIDKLDAFKVTFREALIGITEITGLLKQSVRDQKAGEKEIHQVRQTLRSLQGVRI